jgi:hypothetical protein
MIKNWAQTGNLFSLREVSHQSEKLPPGIYAIRQNPQTQEFFLELTRTTFALPDPLYGCEQTFVDRVLRTYKEMRSNLGVLLNGIKGTGKTVTCQAIANGLGLPVILVDNSYEGKVDSFLGDIQQDVTFFFDEFEKNFPSDYRSGSKLLPIMDGVFKNSSRKVFLLTTSDLNVEPNLIQRPGRIRYLKTFENLDLETIMKIIDSRLTRPHRRDALVRFISELETITIDIVTSVVDETNIHDDDPETFGGFFNIKKNRNEWDVFELLTNPHGKMEESLIVASASIDPKDITSNYVGYTLRANHQVLGEIMEVRDGGVVLTSTDDPKDDDAPPKVRTFRLESVSSKHKVFRNYPLTALV